MFSTWVIHLLDERFDHAKNREILMLLIDYHRNCFYEIYNRDSDMHFDRRLVFCITKRNSFFSWRMGEE